MEQESRDRSWSPKSFPVKVEDAGCQQYPEFSIASPVQERGAVGLQGADSKVLPSDFWRVTGKLCMWMATICRTWAACRHTRVT